MTKSEIEALLGRSLTTKENANFGSYLEIAKEQLEELTCISLIQESGERVFTARDGYRTLFTGIFTEVSSVKIGDDTLDTSKYHSSFFDDRNKDFNNSIVFKDKLDCEDVTVHASWGFDSLPKDLAQLLAQLFALAGKKKRSGNVRSKQVEDFRITYGDLTDMEQLVADNDLVISKYAQCDIFGTRHGKVC